MPEPHPRYVSGTAKNIYQHPGRPGPRDHAVPSPSAARGNGPPPEAAPGNRITPPAGGFPLSLRPTEGGRMEPPQGGHFEPAVAASAATFIC